MLIAGISSASRNLKHGSLLTSTRSMPSDYDFSPEACIMSLVRSWRDSARHCEAPRERLC